MFPYFERKYRIPSDTLHSIALRESGKNHSHHKLRIVWPWTVNVDGQGYFFNSKKEAVAFVRKEMLNGKESIDIGCMQINLKHHPNAFLSLEHAFDPKTNVAYGAEFLRSKYDQLNDWHKAIAHYHSATHELGFKYKQGVVEIAKNMPEYKNNLRYALLQSNARKNIYYQTATKTPEALHVRREKKFHKEMTKSYNFKEKKSNYYKNRNNLMVFVPPQY